MTPITERSASNREKRRNTRARAVAVIAESHRSGVWRKGLAQAGEEMKRAVVTSAQIEPFFTIENPSSAEENFHRPRRREHRPFEKR
jgi:hypothetical protein